MPSRLTKLHKSPAYPEPGCPSSLELRARRAVKESNQRIKGARLELIFALGITTSHTTSGSGLAKPRLGEKKRWPISHRLPGRAMQLRSVTIRQASEILQIQSASIL